MEKRKRVNARQVGYEAAMRAERKTANALSSLASRGLLSGTTDKRVLSFVWQVPQSMPFNKLPGGSLRDLQYRVGRYAGNLRKSNARDYSRVGLALALRAPTVDLHAGLPPFCYLKLTRIK